MTSWIILLIKQYIDIINYLVIGNSIFKIKYEKHNKKEEIVMKILIIEDDLELREELKVLLDNNGYQGIIII